MELLRIAREIHIVSAAVAAQFQASLSYAEAAAEPLEVEQTQLLVSSIVLRVQQHFHC